MTPPQQSAQSISSSPSARVISARNSVMVVFALNGFLFASWMSRIPDIKEMLHLTPGQLSLLLLSISVGAICGLPTSGAILGRLGVVRGISLGLVFAVPGFILTVIAIPLGWPLPVMMAGLFLYGIGNGIWDVGQNLEGTHVEQSLTHSIMPWFHAAFSGGTVVGALVGALMVAIQVPIELHLFVVLIGTLIALFLGLRQFLPSPSSVQPAQTSTSGQDHGLARRPVARARSAWLEPRTLLIGVMVLAAAFTEGVANDWMAVAFVSGHSLEKSVGVIATAVFLTFMTLGRILGTSMLDRFGRVIVLRVLFTCALVGSLLVVFGNTPAAFVGAAIWGLGASLGFPVGMSAAADDPSRAHARISVVSTIGYAAFLGGPPLLGFLGDHVGLLNSFLVVGVVSLLALAIVPSARPLTDTAAPPESDGS